MTCFLFVFSDFETFAGLRCTVKTQHQGRLRRPYGFDPLTAFIEHGLDPAGKFSGDNWVADFQSTGLHQYFGDITSTSVERSFDHCADGFAIGIGLQFE